MVATPSGFISMAVFLFASRVLRLQSGRLLISGAETVLLHATARQLEAQARIVEEVCVRALCIVPLEQPAERFEAEQQATSHFVG